MAESMNLNESERERDNLQGEERNNEATKKIAKVEKHVFCVTRKKEHVKDEVLNRGDMMGLEI